MQYCLAVAVLTGYRSSHDCMVDDPIPHAAPVTLYAPNNGNEAEYICAAVRLAKPDEWVSVALWRDQSR